VKISAILPGPGVTDGMALVIEAIITFNLIFVGLVVSDPRKRSILASVAAGFSIGTGAMAAVSRDGSMYRNYRDISAIPIISASYRIGVFIIVFSIYRIISMTNEISVIFDNFAYFLCLLRLITTSIVGSRYSLIAIYRYVNTY